MQNLQAVPRGTFRPPHIALEPRAFDLEMAEHWILQQAMALTADHFRLTSCWYIDRKTCDTARLAQAENYGVAFSLASALGDPDRRLALQEEDHALVGEDSRALLKDRRYRSDMDRAALIDVVAGHLSDEPSKQVTVDQKRRDKYTAKSRLLADKTELVLRHRHLAKRKLK
jgi:hypothetical protein